ncbi:MAG TPA: hypothetical protein VF633_03755 [Brevundimonas sp.]
MATYRTFIATYIMASERNGTLYTGVSSKLKTRVWKASPRDVRGVQQGSWLHPAGVVRAA